ncbi:hypothetical protein PG987_006526 [Apiospora arundinis]
MEGTSDPSSPQGADSNPGQEPSLGSKGSGPSLPATQIAPDIAALDERLKVFDSKLTLINNIFNLQQETKPRSANRNISDFNDSSESDDSGFDTVADYDGSLFRSAMRETVNLLGKLSTAHGDYQQRKRALMASRKAARRLARQNLLNKADEEESRRISTAAYLENKQATMRWVDWPTFAYPWRRTLQETLQGPFVAVIGELDWQVMNQLNPGDGSSLQMDAPSSQHRDTVDKDPVQVPSPERVKMYSSALHAVFTAICDLSVAPNQHDSSTVFVRPYKEFVYHEKRLRDHLDMLEKTFDEMNRNGALAVEVRDEAAADSEGAVVLQQQPSTEGSIQDGDNKKVDTGEKPKNTIGPHPPKANDESSSSITALLHLRCLMNFFDDEIKPKLEYIASNQCRKILFNDLWHLYKPGDEVIDQAGKQAYRVIQVQSPRHFGKDIMFPFNKRQSDDSDSESEDSEERTPLTVRCAYIDYDGKEFGPVSITFAIHPFGGLKDIDSLPIYPLRLAKDMALRGNLITRGRMLLDITKLQPMYYTGDALHTSEEIDSQVIVDFGEALANEMRKAWTPTIAPTTSQDVRLGLPCLSPCCMFQSISKRHSIDQKLADNFIESMVPKEAFHHPSLIVSPRPLEEMSSSAGNEPTDEEFLVMTYRAFGFVLRTRKWAQLDLTHLRYENQDVRNSTLSAFDRLELPDGHREMVKSLVTQHFRDRRTSRARHDQTDLIRGKGRGLIMLLHGAPGVGKTTTAEGVAESFQKPLFHITCGDLGTTARHVEQELEKNFALASRWGNGLVAVFLRVLEYYTGILFLTTNRIGDFDEAFASRIHMSLYYPELDELKTKKVFKLNLDLIQERFDRQGRRIIYDASSIDDFAQQHYREHVYSRWNGRQIRNACQTALALAEYDAHGGQIAQDDEAADSSVVVALQLRHFRLVQTAYLDFGNYLGDIRGTQGDRRAFDYGLRAKNHTPLPDRRN